MSRPRLCGSSAPLKMLSQPEFGKCLTHTGAPAKPACTRAHKESIYCNISFLLRCKMPLLAPLMKTGFKQHIPTFKCSFTILYNIFLLKTYTYSNDNNVNSHYFKLTQYTLILESRSLSTLDIGN